VRVVSGQGTARHGRARAPAAARRTTGENWLDLKGELAEQYSRRPCLCSSAPAQEPSVQGGCVCLQLCRAKSSPLLSSFPAFLLLLTAVSMPNRVFAGTMSPSSTRALSRHSRWGPAHSGVLAVSTRLLGWPFLPPCARPLLPSHPSALSMSFVPSVQSIFSFGKKSDDL